MGDRAVFLARSLEGHCGPSKDGPPEGKPSSCTADDMGLLPEIPDKDRRSWRAAAAFCAARCRACPRCQWMSISVRYGDCWWYSSCSTRVPRAAFFRSLSIADANAMALQLEKGEQQHDDELLAELQNPPLDVLAYRTIRGYGRTAWEGVPSKLSPPGSGDRGLDATQALLLLGLFSGSYERRALIRCTWLRGLQGAGVRTRFVIGVGHDKHSPPPDVQEGDVLALPIDEGKRLARLDLPEGTGAPRWRVGKHHVTSGGGSLTEYLKIVGFLRYAAQQPEAFVAKADDDSWLSPPLLLAHLAVLQQVSTSRVPPEYFPSEAPECQAVAI